MCSISGKTAAGCAGRSIPEFPSSLHLALMGPVCARAKKKVRHFRRFSFATNFQPPTGLSTGLGSDSFGDTEHNGREGATSICNQSQS